MKVAIICGAGIVSGKEIVALELGKGLREAGIEIHFVTSRWGSGDFGRRAEALRFPVSRLWLGFISATLRLAPIWMTVDQIRRWPALLMGYRRFLREVKPAKVIHTNWHHSILLWPFFRRDRDIYWTHEVMANTRQYRILFQKLSKRVGSFVAVSHATGDALAQLGVPRSMIRVIYNGIADPKGHCDRVREEIGLRIGIVGQIGAWKGHEDLLRAFKSVRETVATAELHIFGNGAVDYLDTLRNLSVELGIDPAITWHGFVSDPRKIYENLAVVTVPSRVVESFGVSAVEAAFFGLPVVASRRGGLPEIVVDNETGYLVNAESPGDIAARLKALLQDRDLRLIMGRRARQRALEQFSQKRFGKEFAEMLQSEA